MTRRQLEEATCDRCSRTEAKSAGSPWPGWVLLTVGGSRVPAFQAPRDLCPTCIHHLAMWWAALGDEVST